MNEKMDQEQNHLCESAASWIEFGPGRHPSGTGPAAPLLDVLATLSENPG
jgi:hypothetical protein